MTSSRMAVGLMLLTLLAGCKDRSKELKRLRTKHEAALSTIATYAKYLSPGLSAKTESDKAWQVAVQGMMTIGGATSSYTMSKGPSGESAPAVVIPEHLAGVREACTLERAPAFFAYAPIDDEQAARLKQCDGAVEALRVRVVEIHETAKKDGVSAEAWPKPWDGWLSETGKQAQEMLDEPAPGGG